MVARTPLGANAVAYFAHAVVARAVLQVVGAELQRLSIARSRMTSAGR